MRLTWPTIHQAFLSTSLIFLSCGTSRLDGILIANSFHFVADKEKLIHKLEAYFSASPMFLIVEYDADCGNRWVPYPISFDKLQILFSNLGYPAITRLASQPSKFGGNMFAALIRR